jgi:hypothetical protein
MSELPNWNPGGRFDTGVAGSIKLEPGCTITIYNDKNFTIIGFGSNTRGYTIDEVKEFVVSEQNISARNILFSAPSRPKDTAFIPESLRLVCKL